MKKIIFLSLWVIFLMGGFLLPAHGQENVPATKISADLDKVLKTQQEIKQQLAEMKEELYIIKIRASR